MTTFYTSTFVASNATDAALRISLGQVKTNLTNSLWVQTADTGQVDFAAVTYTATASAVYGYQVYYLNDSLHATFPIYMKIYVWNSSAGSIQILAKFGFAMDGAGNFTGNTYPASGNGVVMAGGVYTTYAFGEGAGNGVYGCGGNGFSTVCHMINTSSWTNNRGFFFHLSREWDDSTGAPTGGNFSYYAKDYMAITYSTFHYNRTTNTAITGAAAVAYNPYERTVSQNAANTDLIAHYASFPSASTPTFKRMGSIVGYNAAEMSQGTTFTAQPLTGGSARTFFASPVLRSSFNNATANFAMAFIWE